MRGGEGQPPCELWGIPWTWVQEICDGIETVGYRIIAGNGANYLLAPEDVVHYRLMGGRSPLEPLRRTLGIEDAAMDWQKQNLDNGPSLRGAFSTDKELRERTIPRLRAELEELYGGPGGKALGLFDQGLSFKSISQSVVDAGIIDTRKLSREESAAAFGIPAPMIGILDHATYSNITELRRSFYVDTVAPYLTLIEETEEAQLIVPEPSWAADGVFTEFDMGEILKPDPLAEAQSLMLLTSCGTNATNDNRKLKRMDPIGDPADPENPYNRPRVPANLSTPWRRRGPLRPAAAASAHDALVREAMRAGRSTPEEDDDAPRASSRRLRARSTSSSPRSAPRARRPPPTCGSTTSSATTGATPR